MLKETFGPELKRPLKVLMIDDNYDDRTRHLEVDRAKWDEWASLRRMTIATCYPPHKNLRDKIISAEVLVREAVENGTLWEFRY